MTIGFRIDTIIMLKKFFRSKKLIFGVEVADWLLVLIGLTLFAVITLVTISKSSIWFDEAFSVYLTKFNFFEIARYTATDVHPPFYYWILKLWVMIFGNSVLAFRSLSLLMGELAIVIGYLLTNRLFGAKAARFSLLFMVLSPMLVRYSQEARMYTLVTVIALAATYVLTYAVNSKKKLPWVIYGILISLGMWTHYFSAIIWIAHWIWRADDIRRKVGKDKFFKTFFSKEWILAHVVAIALFLPWIKTFLSQMFAVQAFGFWIPAVTPETIPNFLTNVFLYLDINKVNGWWTIAFFAVITILIAFSVRTYKVLNDKQRQSYRLIATIAFVPTILLFIMSLPPLRSAFIERYLMTSVVGIAMFVGITFAFNIKKFKIDRRTVGLIIAVCLMVFGISNVWFLGNYNKNTDDSNETMQIIEAVNKKSKAGEPIIVATPWLFYEASFYSNKHNSIYYIEPSEYNFGSLDMLKYNDESKIKQSELASFSKSNPIIWYVGYLQSNEVTLPNSDWKVLEKIYIQDRINGGNEYEAIKCQISPAK